MKHVRIMFTVDSYFDDDEDIGKMSDADAKQAVEDILYGSTYREVGETVMTEGSLTVEVVK